MPLLSVRIIKKARKARTCDICGHDMDGEQIRIYGMADIGDKPYPLFVHRKCAGKATAAAVEVLERKE